MKPEQVREVDIAGWVDAASVEQRNFREAVHLILTAISRSAA
jgi:hypothetical protein